jgi:hypothetical protein
MRIAKVLVGSASVTFISLFPVTPVAAQSPAPNAFMEDFAPGTTTLNLNPHASAYLVKGLGSLSCTYSQASIETQTATWINDSYNTITMIDPQPVCGTISQYESLLSGIASYVESHSLNPGDWWGGFMLDEEPQWFSSSQYTTLNNYVRSLMAGEPGMSFVFTEDSTQWSGGNWSLSQYNNVVSGTWMAPQVYNQNIANIANQECSTYGNCVNAITTSNYPGYGSWQYESYADPLVNGSAWTNAYWGSVYWYNEFCYQNCSTYTFGG